MVGAWVGVDRVKKRKVSAYRELNHEFQILHLVVCSLQP
jgi:hypothetical protein